MNLDQRVFDFIHEAGHTLKTSEGTFTAKQMMERFLFPSDLQSVPIGKLSGGERRRLYLLSVLMSAPNVLLLDEPLGALDAFTRMNMQDEILKIWRERRQLAIMVTHDVDEAIYMGTRVIVMDANPGRILTDITISDEYPRDRSSASFVAYRNEILNALHFGGKH